jgi:hypothetical protein
MTQLQVGADYGKQMNLTWYAFQFDSDTQESQAQHIYERN